MIPAGSVIKITDVHLLVVPDPERSMSENQNVVGGYELKNCVASGASTQIWEVVQQGTTTPLAMKLLLPDAFKDPDAKAVLKHEFKVGSTFEHPNLVRLHKLEVNRDHGFYIMDYFRAPSLKAQISANLAETQSRFKKIAEAVCQALVHMNEKGWLHRDIKPDNILVNKTGEVRVIDFSLSTKLATGLMKLLSGKQKAIMGTRTYIAPEIILKNPPTAQSDIYSLGVAFYEVVTGNPPFAGMSPSDLLKKHISESPAPPSLANPNVTPELDAVILRMLSKKPKDRYAEMREVMSALRNVKCFKEDPFELYERKVKEAKANESLSVDKRLDSRADADRVSRGIAAPAKPTKGKRMTAPIGEMEAVKKIGAGKNVAPAAQAQPAAMPMMPGLMPGMVPQMPYGMPPQGMPGMMYPGMMQQPMMPQVPMMPQQMMQPFPPGIAAPQTMSPQGMPQSQPTSSVSNSASQPAASGASPVQPATTPPKENGVKNLQLPLERRTAKSSPPEVVEDLDFMTELPDIS
jgi:serine/threonine protein kinase